MFNQQIYSSSSPDEKFQILRVIGHIRQIEQKSKVLDFAMSVSLKLKYDFIQNVKCTSLYLLNLQNWLVYNEFLNNFWLFF